MLITCDQSEMASSLLLLRQYTEDAQHMSGIYESAMKMINSSASRVALSLLLIAQWIMTIHYLEIYPALVKKATEADESAMGAINRPLQGSVSCVNRHNRPILMYG